MNKHCRNRPWAETLLLAYGLAALGVLLAVLGGSRQPPDLVYRGKPLSFWVIELEMGDSHQARRVFGELGLKGLPALLSLSLNENDLPRGAIPRALCLLGTNAIPGLMAACDSPNHGVRLTAARALSSTPDLGPYTEAVLTRFIKLANDPAIDLREWAVLGISRQKNPPLRSIPALVFILQRAEVEETTVTVQRAAYLLGRMGPAAEMAVPALTELLSNRSPGVRHFAAIALWSITLDRDLILPSLTAALADSDATDRNQAAQTLARIGRETPLSACLVAKVAEIAPAAAANMLQLNETVEWRAEPIR